MKMVTVREFRANPTEALKVSRPTEDVVLTNNGKPVALLWPVDEGNLEESLKMARRIRAERAAYNIAIRAKRLGLDKMTMDEINAEIAVVRTEAKAKGARKP
jgi:prevent-host-death family protein